MTSADVRSKLVESLELDLVGPRPGLGDATEILTQPPSRWYLTGFLDYERFIYICGRLELRMLIFSF